MEELGLAAPSCQLQGGGEWWERRGYLQLSTFLSLHNVPRWGQGAIFHRKIRPLRALANGRHLAVEQDSGEQVNGGCKLLCPVFMEPPAPYAAAAAGAGTW